MSVAADIAAHLEANDFGIIGTDLFINTMPDAPDAQVSVIEYGGSPSAMSMGGSVTVELPRVQISARNLDPSVAYEKAHDIYAALDGAMDKTLNGTLYFLLRALQPPFFLRRDERDRPVYGFNLEIQKRQ